MGCPWLGGGSGSCLVALSCGHSSQPIAGTASLSAPLGRWAQALSGSCGPWMLPSRILIPLRCADLRKQLVYR